MPKNILPRCSAKPIEQLEDGSWIVRYDIRMYGKDGEGNELVTFASSQYPEKPTMKIIERSINRYGVSLSMYGEDIPLSVAHPDMSLYSVID